MERLTFAKKIVEEFLLIILTRSLEWKESTSKESICHKPWKLPTMSLDQFVSERAEKIVELLESQPNNFRFVKKIYPSHEYEFDEIEDVEFDNNDFPEVYSLWNQLMVCFPLYSELETDAQDKARQLFLPRIFELIN